MRVLRAPVTWFLYFCQKIPTHDMCDMHGMHRWGTEYMRKNKTRFPTDLLRCNTSPNMTEANDVCGGGEVIFNTSHQNYIYSLSVEHQWLCSSVSLSPSPRSIFIGFLSRKSAVRGLSRPPTSAPSSTPSHSGSWWTSGAGSRSSTSPTSPFSSAGWSPTYSPEYMVTFDTLRLVSFHVTDHYWAFLVLTALGTSFFPVGVRAG